MNRPFDHLTIKTLPVLIALFFSIGCAGDALVFHERTKVAFNMEAQKSPSNPVNLSLGYKRQMLAIVPSKYDKKKGDDDKEGSTNESLSVISTFDLKTEEKTSPLPFLSRDITINNNFATGRAAVAFAKASADELATQEANLKDAGEKVKTASLSYEVAETKKKLLGTLIDSGKVYPPGSEVDVLKDQEKEILAPARDAFVANTTAVGNKQAELDSKNADFNAETAKPTVDKKSLKDKSDAVDKAKVELAQAKIAEEDAKKRFEELEEAFNQVKQLATQNVESIKKAKKDIEDEIEKLKKNVEEARALWDSVLNFKNKARAAAKEAGGLIKGAFKNALETFLSPIKP